MTILLDGTGSGNAAGVTKDHRVLTQAHISPFQHHLAHHHEDTYQVIGVATASSGAVPIIHVKNNDTEDKLLTVTYIRVQSIGLTGGTALPSSGNYFSLAMNQEYSSGGSEAVPVNCTSGSSKTANVTAFQGGPTLIGTASEFDRWYPDTDGQQNIWSKEGSVIIPTGQSLSVSYVGDHSAGTLYTRISFAMDPQEH